MTKACYRELHRYKYQLVEDYELDVGIPAHGLLIGAFGLQNGEGHVALDAGPLGGPEAVYVCERGRAGSDDYLAVDDDVAQDLTAPHLPDHWALTFVDNKNGISRGDRHVSRGGRPYYRCRSHVDRDVAVLECAGEEIAFCHV